MNGPLAVAIMGAVGPLEAQVALDTIRDLSDQTQSFGLVAGQGAGAGVAVVARDSVNDAVSSRDTGRHWLVFQDIEADSLQILRILPSTRMEPQNLPSAVLIVSPANGS